MNRLLLMVAPLLANQCLEAAEPSAKLARLLAASEEERALLIGNINRQLTDGRKIDAQRIQYLRRHRDEHEKAPFIRPRIVPKELKVGQIGGIAYLVDIFQVIDKRNMLIKASDTVIWLQGFDTAGLVDDGRIKLTELLEVVGTRTYEAAIGTNTIFVVEPFDDTELKQHLAALAAAKKRRAAEELAASEAKIEATRQRIEVAKRRTWTSGQYKVEAQFVSFISGKVTLKRLDNGKEITLPMELLSKEDQEFIRQRKWLRKKP